MLILQDEREKEVGRLILSGAIPGANKFQFRLEWATSIGYQGETLIEKEWDMNIVQNR
ncbi:MAG: hypothetical protein GF311_28620 [Candidatus Lokiarchaeota archaeon]|nr:hypothetical protein [Candidatus Lokiarchaeota archaeon]